MSVVALFTYQPQCNACSVLHTQPHGNGQQRPRRRHDQRQSAQPAQPRGGHGEGVRRCTPWLKEFKIICSETRRSQFILAYQILVKRSKFPALNNCNLHVHSVRCVIIQLQSIMGLADYKDLLGTSASICTIIQLLVPVWMCRKYITDGTTGETSSLPFVVGCLSSSLWLKYGLLLGETSLIVVNSIAVILQIGYVVVFYRYCSKKNQIILQMVGVSAILILTLLYTAFEADERIVVYRVGMLCCLMTVMFFAAPLSQLAYVMRVRSAESLPFLLIVMTFITSVQWLLYGYIIKDPFVQIPNFLGLLLSSFQLSLFVIFPAQRRSQENARPLYQDVGIAQ